MFSFWRFINEAPVVDVHIITSFTDASLNILNMESVVSGNMASPNGTLAGFINYFLAFFLVFI